MMKPLRIFGIVCCIAFSSVMFASAENATDELQMQIYDLDGEPDLTKKAPKPTPRKTAPRPEAADQDLGAGSDQNTPAEQRIDGYWMGLSKRSLQIA